MISPSERVVLTHPPERAIFVLMPTSYTVRFTERRPSGRTKPLIVQKVGPASLPQVWGWVADMLKASTPDVLERITAVQIAPATEPVTEEVKP